MNTRVAIAGLLCFLTACAVSPSGHSAADAPLHADPAPGGDAAASVPAAPVPAAPVPAATGKGPAATGKGPAATKGSAPPTVRLALPPQFSPAELFMEEYGDFMLKMEPWRPDLRLSYLVMADAQVKDEPGDFDLRYGEADLRTRVQVDPQSYLELGAEFGHRFYQFSSAAAGAHDETLYKAGLDLGYGVFLDKDVLLDLHFRPGVYSDFSGTLHHGDWQFLGSGLVTWRVDEQTFLKGGIEYSTLFRDVDVYPLVGVAWNFDPQWRLDVLLPRTARVTYEHDPSTSFFVSVDLDGAEYRIRTPRPARIGRDINVQELELSVGAQHRFDKVFSIHGRIGTTLAGDYNFQSNGAGAYDGTLEPALFAEIGFGITF